MDTDPLMVSLLRHVYAAAADESRWPAALERLADAFHGGVAGFQTRVDKEGRVRSTQFVGVDAALQHAIRTHYASRNPWVRRTQALLYPGVVIASDRLVPLRDLTRTEYYDGILRPIGVAHCFGAGVLRYGEEVTSFTVVRSRAQGLFEEHELTRARELTPHLQRALQVNARLRPLQRAHTALADGLEQLRHGVFLVDRRGRVLLANRAGRTITAARDGLSLDADGLRPASASERARLRLLIDGAARSAAGETFSSGGAMTIGRPSLRRPYLVLVSPLSPALTPGHDTRHDVAAVFVSDPESAHEPLGAFTARLYGLTGGELRVAEALAAHSDLARAADTLGISHETARWHLRNLYRKTGARRQADLVRRLLAVPSLLATEPRGDEPTPR